MQINFVVWLSVQHVAFMSLPAVITDLSLTFLQNCSAKHSGEGREEGLTDFCISGNVSRRRL